MTDKVLVFLAEGFETIEALTTVDYLRRAGIAVDCVSTTGEKAVKSAQKVIVMADLLLEDISDFSNYTYAYIPGGLPAAPTLAANSTVLEAVQEIAQNGKAAAICAGPLVLEAAGLLEGKTATSFPGLGKNLSCTNYSQDMVVVDGNILTARGPAATVFFALELIRQIAGEEKMQEIKKQILQDQAEAWIKQK